MPRKHRTLTEDHKGTGRFAVQLFSCPYLRKSASICGLSRRRTSASSVESLCGGGFVCCSRAFAVLFCALCALLRLFLLRLGLGELDLAFPHNPRMSGSSSLPGFAQRKSFTLVRGPASAGALALGIIWSG